MLAPPDATHLIPLDYTYVVYDPANPLSQPLALLTLSPFFLFSAYATLIIINRPLSVANILIGQLSNEALNKVLKRAWKAERPWILGDGYGMPSSHSQFLGFSSTFMILHLTFIHHRFPGGRRTTLHSTPTSTLTRRLLVTGLIIWPLLTGYSRYHLHYHSSNQVIVGLTVGAVAGAIWAGVTEVIPFWWPGSLVGRGRRWLGERWERWPVMGFGGFGPGGRETGRWLAKQGRKAD